MAINKLTPTTLTGNVSAKPPAPDSQPQQGQITRASGDLSSVARPLVIRGEVQGQNPDGTTRITTPQGDIDIRLDAPPPKGQKIELQIPAGNPPREATVQPRAQQHPIQAQPRAQDVKAQTPSTQPPPAIQEGAERPANTIIESVRALQTTAKQAIETLAKAVRQSVDPTQIGKSQDTPLPQNAKIASPPPISANARILNTGQVVRLIPLPAALQTPQGLAQLPSIPQGQALTTGMSPVSPAGVFPVTVTNHLPPPPSGTIHTPTQFVQMPTIRPLQVTNLLPIHNAATPQGQTLFPVPPPAIGQATMPPTQVFPPLIFNNTVHPPLMDAYITAIKIPVVQSNPATASLLPPINFTGPTATPLSSPVMPGQILAQTTGHMTPQGNPVIQIIPSLPSGITATPQFFALHYPAQNLPAGTQIILQPNTAIVPSQSSTPFTPSAWPVMTEAFEEILAQLPPLQAQSLLNIIPRPAATGYQFTATALLFIAAARGGELSGWMGGRADQMLRAMSVDRKDMASRLLSDIGRLTGRSAAGDPQAPAATQGSSEWRGYTLPALFGMDLGKIHLWTRPFGEDGDHDPAKSDTRGTRFIVDLDLSRMGRVQLDGLVRPTLRRLDLALRTEHDFTPDIRRHLRQRWHGTLANIGMTGDIDFQKT